MKEELLKKVGEAVPEEALEALLNEWIPNIFVDRSIHPEYPDFLKVIHPNLELTGPTEFDVTKLERYFHPKQVKGVAGSKIFEKLIANKMLEGCLGLADLQAIQLRGVGFFRKYFPKESVPGWKSVVLNSYDQLHVPCLYESFIDGVALEWHYLGSLLDSSYPALRYASTKC